MQSSGNSNNITSVGDYNVTLCVKFSYWHKIQYKMTHTIVIKEHRAHSIYLQREHVTNSWQSDVTSVPTVLPFKYLTD